RLRPPVDLRAAAVASHPSHPPADPLQGGFGDSPPRGAVLDVAWAHLLPPLERTGKEETPRSRRRAAPTDPAASGREPAGRPSRPALRLPIPAGGSRRTRPGLPEAASSTTGRQG